MKHNIIKNAIAALFTAALPVGTQAQVERAPFTSPEYLPASPLRAGECDDYENLPFDASGETPRSVAISGGLWIMAGAAMVYGVALRRTKDKRQRLNKPQ